LIVIAVRNGLLFDSQVAGHEHQLLFGCDTIIHLLKLTAIPVANNSHVRWC